VLARIVLSLVLCGLFACGGNSRAPVEDRGAQEHSFYTVKSGDTLYSIAFRYGLDYRKVAEANGIGASYTIYPGQQLRLDEAALTEQISVPQEASVPKPAPVPRQQSLPSYTPTPGPISSGPMAPEPVVQNQPSVSEQAPLPAPVATPPTAAVKPEARAGSYAGGKVEAWLWPASGPVTRGYSESVHKGIDIGGARGDPIVAVAAGKVVYAGTGIVGFGELVIVKHNEVYLSAYGHNDRLLVGEGETVTPGQTIAEKGSSGTDTVKLHFEIRKEGKPIDPQRLLPRR
jgi:lipoprotein NlpD